MSAQRVRRVSPSSTAVGDGTPSADYVSAFELDPHGTRRTAEHWARSVFEHAPAVMRILLVLGWRLVLGLRLGPRPATGFVLGWHIASAEPEILVLESHSPFLTARNIVAASDSTVTWTTLVRFDRRIARPVWNIVRPVHELAIPYLLRRAAGRA
ncbi:DUF2867 domain-containing protein [Nocardia sp. BMG111209]|uniref:DUF2867 domain-containing protein n=1 Tax=Nocardia sp. BMG111209 TaxID=1160137 RepID=UPI0003A146E1|nr:DUF2867 domain-containing protein [Nocardia sp. BMG111209]